MSELPEMLAVVVVRERALPRGADEAVAEAGGAVLLCGTGTAAAAGQLTAATRSWTLESPVAPAALAAALAPLLDAVRVVLLPSSPDGRDLAPRLAFATGRDLRAGATRCDTAEADLVRLDDALEVRVRLTGPSVVTLLPGQRGVDHPTEPPTPTDLTPDPRITSQSAPGITSQSGVGIRGFSAVVRDAEVVEVVEGGAESVELEEAERIFGGGAGLVPDGADGAAVMRDLGEVAAALGASAGATRVVSDAGWVGHERQIGTTGAVVDPRLYVAFGISGATQHTGGLGRPEHVVSINTDPSCPMTAMADLGIVADAPAVLDELARRLLGSRDG
ncbi:mycofactocin-associated electron transfer flavoprotein alpha subunit [Saccharopolyspora griseoalba]|uniref:Mycofactocin-associated electron transfer flavoprotein alpha subunit n=1 Tax=Saccharopolyspora griseoalba TaxID=1431848 RepID=A0ABW2LJP8_9PSEU